MPVYVYRNLTTGETFELEQRITEAALSAHPETGDPVKRLIQPVGIAFKGSGFYVTDSRSAKASASKSAADSQNKAVPPKEGSGNSSGKGDNSSGRDGGTRDSSSRDSSSRDGGSKDGRNSAKTDTAKTTKSSSSTSNT